jgi:hypothetical protein
MVFNATFNNIVYSIQHYVIKFVSDLRQFGVFLRFPPPIKLTTTIYEILLKVALNTINQTNKTSLAEIDIETKKTQHTWWSVLLVEETGETHRTVANH